MNSLQRKRLRTVSCSCQPAQRLEEEGGGEGGGEGGSQEDQAPIRRAGAGKGTRNLGFTSKPLIFNRNVSALREAKQSLSAGQVGINGRVLPCSRKTPCFVKSALILRITLLLGEAGNRVDLMVTGGLQVWPHGAPAPGELRQH